LGNSPDQTRRLKLNAVSAIEVLVPYTTCGQYESGGVDHLTQGVPLDVVSETLKHTSIRITKDPYSHLFGAQRKHAADAMDAALSVKSETHWLPGLAANGAGYQVSDRPSGTGGDD
jgi:hypothetical protein